MMRSTQGMQWRNKLAVPVRASRVTRVTDAARRVDAPILIMLEIPTSMATIYIIGRPAGRLEAIPILR